MTPNRLWQALECLFVFLSFTPALRADWKSDANARIDQFRKRHWILQAQTAAGQPVAGATFEVRQRRHQFAFGCALNSFALVREPRYGEFFARNFEWAVFELEAKWTEDEPLQGQVTYTRPDLLVAFCRKHGITMRGHCTFWEATSAGFEHPAWLDPLGNTALRAAVEARLNSVVPHYQGIFQHWDINNEMLHGNFFRGRLGASIVPFMFQRTRALEPRVQRFVNDFNVIEGSETDAYKSQIQALIASGAPVEGIGVQGHFGGQIIDPVVLKARLDNLGTLGLPIWISEYDSVQANETNRADNLETLYRVAFSQNSVQGILMWGFWANAHWLGSNAAIVNANWTLNAAGQRYTNLMQEWTTVTTGLTDANGSFSFRGFHGDYDVKLSAIGQTSVTQALVLNSGAFPQTDLVSFGPPPKPPVNGDLIGGNVMALNWARFPGALSCLVEASTNLNTWEMVSPRLDPLATAWTQRLTNGNPRRFFRVRSDPLPPPDFDFYEVTGAARTASINNSGQLTVTDTGVIHRDYVFFTAPDLRNGVFSLTEDPAEPSPNGGPPGALRFRIDAKPTTLGLDFWGFFLQPGSVPEWPSSSVTTNNLSKTRLRFRYKLTSGRAIDVRLEPASAGFNERCDFANITGNGQWQEFNRLLSSGSNLTPFLDFLNSAGERYLKLVYAAGAGLATYSTGDTLLLDDVSLYYDP